MSPTEPTKPERFCGADAVTAQCYPHECQRIGLICARDGIAAAVDFSWRTGHIYRTAVLASSKRGHHHPHFASLPEYRAKFIGSYLDFKRFYLSRHATAADQRIGIVKDEAAGGAATAAARNDGRTGQARSGSEAAIAGQVDTGAQGSRGDKTPRGK